MKKKFLPFQEDKREKKVLKINKSNDIVTIFKVLFSVFCFPGSLSDFQSIITKYSDDFIYHSSRLTEKTNEIFKWDKKLNMKEYHIVFNIDFITITNLKFDK